MWRFYIWGLLVVRALWCILCICSHLVFSSCQTVTMIRLPAGECSSLSGTLWKIFFFFIAEILLILRHFHPLWICRPFPLIIGHCQYYSYLLDCFCCRRKAVSCVLKALFGVSWIPSAYCSSKHHAWKLIHVLYLHYWWRNNEVITSTCPWKLLSDCPFILELQKKTVWYWRALITTGNSFKT